MKRKYLILVFLSAYFLTTSNIYGDNNCSRLILESKKKSDQVLKKIELLRKCAKPAVKYRLKACIQRKQEGSKGFECSDELIKKIKQKENCGMKFVKIEALFKQLKFLILEQESCLKSRS